MMNRAIELALDAENEGNLPIGCVICLDHEIIAEGRNTMLFPVFNPGMHAEMNAIGNVSSGLWARANEMICYTTLEPCCMCFGRILLCGIGKVVFGALDTEGGSGCLLHHLPRYYSKQNIPRWQGPIMPEVCDDLYKRAALMFGKINLQINKD